jgi:hypothetical protein
VVERREDRFESEAIPGADAAADNATALGAMTAVLVDFIGRFPEGIQPVPATWQRRVLYQLNISRFTLIGRSYVETRLEGSGQMGLIDKACRLRDVGERRDTFSQHRYSSL